MHALKWWNLHTRMFFAPDDGGGAAATPSAPPSGGDGGGSSVPAEPTPVASPASPEPATPDPVVTPPAADDNPWANLGSADDLDYLAVPPTPPAPVAPAPVVPPAATPPVAPAAQPPATPPAEPAPTPPQPAEAPPVAPSPSDPVSIANAIEANRDAVIAHLATSKFALSETDLAELETDVAAAVPKLLSRVFMESQISMQKFLAQAVPGMIKNYQAVTTKNADAENKFFEAHKALGLDIKNAQHKQVASRIASIYRQNNPTIPLDQLIQEVGPMVAMSLKLNAPPAAPAAAVTTPAGAPRGGTPFRPAVNGGGGAPPTPVDENPWAGLGQTFD